MWRCRDAWYWLQPEGEPIQERRVGCFLVDTVNKALMMEGNLRKKVVELLYVLSTTSS